MVKKFDFFKWSLLVLPEPPDPLDYSPPGFYINGALQTRILEWVVIPFSSGSSQSRDQTWVLCTASRFFTT